MDDIVPMKVVDCLEHLLDGLRRILFGKTSLIADTVEQLSTSSQLRDNIVFVLSKVSAGRRLEMWCLSKLTLDSNQSTNLTIWGCFSRCSISNSSSTIRSLPLTFFFRMILMATCPVGPSASRTMPYVPAPSVLPNRYRDLQRRRQYGCNLAIRAVSGRTSCHNSRVGHGGGLACWKLDDM